MLYSTKDIGFEDVSYMLRAGPNRDKAFFEIGEDHWENWKWIRWFLKSGDKVTFHNLRDVIWVILKRSMPTTTFSDDEQVLVFDVLPYKGTKGELRILQNPERLPIVVPIEKVRDTKWKNDEKPWAKWPRQALLSSSESHLLYDAAKRLGSGNYVSLGVWKGHSTAYFGMGLQTTGSYHSTVYAVDVFDIPNVKNMPKTIPEQWESFGLRANLKICKGFTNEWAKKLSDKTFRVVFVDAGHSYWDARGDIENWSPMIEVGGELIMHDCNMETVNWAIEDTIGDNWKETQNIWRTRVFRRIK